jgi:hypothetical protein
VFIEKNRRLRGHRFYPTARELATYPKIYAQDGKGLDAIVHVHYFAPAGDWWVTEFAKDFDVTGAVFGYVRMAGDQMGGEFTYFNLLKLEQALGRARHGLPVPIYVERDCYWTPKTIRQAARICGPAEHFCRDRAACAA